MFIVVGTTAINLDTVTRVELDATESGDRGVRVHFLGGSVFGALHFPDDSPAAAQLRAHFGYAPPTAVRISPRGYTILAALAGGALAQGATHAQLMHHTGFPKASVSVLLGALVRGGYLKTLPGTHTRRYILAPSGLQALRTHEGAPA